MNEQTTFMQCLLCLHAADYRPSGAIAHLRRHHAKVLNPEAEGTTWLEMTKHYFVSFPEKED